jgi:membrane peptidoglycan carboxypeptidase
MDLDTIVPDELFGVPLGGDRELKWIRNYDDRFKGPIPMRQTLAESRNAAAVWVACQIGLGEVARTARELGIRSPVQPYASMALGASEVRLLELADAYRSSEPTLTSRVSLV